MKPILLKMTAFGPYLKETIDFRKIENKGIFLITGDTGSGKTTIFDAICVALFGESNGAERTAESFKSDFDQDNETMSIEFSFELKGRFFRVVRTPRQRRKKLRGEGFTDDLGDATLYETISGEEKPIEFFKGVNARIESILGLNARQFRQIVMIPQGQFRKLITEDSVEREKILKSIFNVDKYELFQNKLSSFNKELEYKLFERKNLLNVEVSHIKSPEGSALEALISAQQKNIRAIIDETEALIKEDDCKLEELYINIASQKKQIQMLNDQIENSKKTNALLDAFEEKQAEKVILEQSKAHYLDLNQEVNMAERAFRIKPLEEFHRQQVYAIETQKTVILDKNQELQRLELSLAQSIEIYERLKTPENLKGIEKEKEQLIFYKNIFVKVEGYENLKKNLEDFVLQFSKEEATLKSLKQDQIEKQETFNQMSLKKEQWTGQLVDIEKTQAILVELNGQLEVVNELENQCLEYIQILKKHDGSTKAFEQIKSEKEQHEHLYEEQQIHWFEGQAGLLAQSLKEGDACPVCGNEHPVKIAQLSEEMPTKEHLDALKLRKAQLEQKYNACQMALVSEEQNKTNKREQLRLLFKKVLEIFQVTLTFDREAILLFCKEQRALLQTKETQTKITFQRLKEDSKRLNLLVADIQTLNKILVGNTERLEVLQQEHHKTHELKTTKESELEVIEKDLPQELRKKKQILEAMTALENNIKEMEARMESSKAIYEGIQKNHTIAKATLSEIQKVQFEREKACENSLREFQQALLDNGFKDKEHYIFFKRTQVQIDELKAAVNHYNQKVHANLQRLLQLTEEVKGMSKIAIIAIEENRNHQMLIQETLSKNHTMIYLRKQDNETQIKIIDGIFLDIILFTQQQALVGDLSQVANGTAAGTVKITFERYILAAFLQEIVDAANIRFGKMSNGRYELIRKNQSADKRKHTGLDLEVFDYYTGKARDVNTLSGGEGFKASLALALGLADIAQAYAGGISLDTMFVDEGFGSLSAESLDHAINCLMDLKEGGRLVGIISHVQELKDRIDTQLVVEKTKYGSRTYFEGV